MTLHRTFVARTAALAGVLAAVAAPAGAAHAHGATTDPVSRAAACGPEGGARQQSAACRAAAAVNGARGLPEWDNLRVPNVAGRDRERIPDGQLCSAGLPDFRGLDLPRADWPTTRLTGGAAYTFRYRGTIGHQGTFRLYATRAGYDPTKPLRWSDLDAEPFLTAVDPELRDGSYELKGRLPASRSGRHVIYAVWQNSDTPDTYYSCSDVDFAAAAAPGPQRSASAGDSAAVAAAPGAGGSAPRDSASRDSASRDSASRDAASRDAASRDAAAGDSVGGAPAAASDLTGAPGAGPSHGRAGPLVVAGLAALLAVATAVAAVRRVRRTRRKSGAISG